MGTNKIKTTYTRGLEDRHNKEFLETNTVESYKKKFEKMKLLLPKNINPILIAQLNNFENHVLSLLSKDISEVLQDTISKEYEELQIDAIKR